jgi:putative transposase
VIWQADHSLLDILIHCETEKPVKNVKPWLTIIIDDHSRSIAVITCLLSHPLQRRRLLR